MIHQAFSPKNNTVYIAQKTLGSLDPSLAGIPGGGAFDKIIKPDLVLSDLTQRYFSVWKLPVWFMRPLGNPPMHLTYHPPVIPKSGRSRWTNLGNGFCQLQTVGRGQEFVLDCNNYGSQALSWALKILFLAKGNFR